MKKLFDFNDIGKKIKHLAKWLCWVEIILIWIASLIALGVLLANEFTQKLFWVPLLTALIAPLIIWIKSWLAYAFGDMVDNIACLRQKFCAEDIAETTEKIKTERKNETKGKDVEIDAPASRMTT